MSSRPLLLALLAFDLAGLAVLHGLGSQPWAQLDPAAPPQDAVMAVLRIVGLVVGWWLAGSTLLYALAHVGRARRLAAGLRRLTLPVARRLVDASLVATLTIGPTTAVTAFEAEPPIVAIETPPRTSPQVPPPVVAPPRRTTPSPSRSTTRRPPPTPDNDGGVVREQHVVRSGEHLWAIAAGTLGETRPEHIARYWRRLVEANRDRLRSGQPDLIYPGEVVLLPPLDDH